LFIEVPNEASLENRIFGKHSYLYDVPRHLYDFSPATISALLTKAGYSVETVCCTSGSGGWLGSVQRVLTGGRGFRQPRTHMGRLIVFWLLFGPLDYWSSFTKGGSIMNAVARKQR